MSIRDLQEPALLSDTGLLAQEEDEAEYYYDLHPTKEDLMGESIPQLSLIRYMMDVLEWYCRKQGWLVAGNLNIYQTRDKAEYPLAPDVAFFKGVVLTKAQRGRLRSWKMTEPNRPAPTVVFEVASKDTWRDDLTTKPAQYRTMGVKEYFAYDPNDPQYWRDKTRRLRGWRLNADQLQELKPDKRGWLWSEELDSWLGADGEFLRLYDKAGNMRLTKAQAEQAAKEVAWAKLRELGINPEDL